jgi:hypothetical protein
VRLAAKLDSFSDSQPPRARQDLWPCPATLSNEILRKASRGGAACRGAKQTADFADYRGSRPRYSYAGQTQNASQSRPDSSPLIDKVRAATARFRDLNVAIAEGWVQGTPCVSGPDTSRKR